MSLKFKELSLIESQLLSRIKKIYILRTKHVSSVIYITTDDEVYWFLWAENETHILDGKKWRHRLYHNNCVSEPTLIPELCGKQVIDIEFGNNFMVALTQTHEVYTCGNDRKGVLGNGLNDGSNRRPQKLIIDKSFVDIKCYHFRTYLLSEDNQLFWFGCMGDDNINTPTLIEFNEDIKIVNISCGLYHTLALTDCGKVYSFGENVYGQLGLGHNNNMFSPQLIQMTEGVNIKRISVGYKHNLLLTTDGNIYSFGCNESYELGVGKVSQNSINTPTLIKSNGIKFIDIFASVNTSMALNEFNKILIWGMNNIMTPFQINVISFEAAIDIYKPELFIFKLSPEEVFHKKECCRVFKSMSQLFNRCEDSDFKFKLKRKESEDTFDYIYGHKWFIGKTSEHFGRMFANNWSENQTNEIQINDFSYEAFYHFIRCLYTDSIDTEDIEILIELLSITDQYLDEEMKQKCVQTIKPLINVQNVSSFYKISKTFRSKELEDFCFKFMSTNNINIETEV